MIPKWLLPYMASMLLLLFLSQFIPVPEVQFGLVAAAVLVALYVVYKAFWGIDREEAPLLPSATQILLFSNVDEPGEDSIQCPHCGEYYGLGIRLCPRCKRPVLKLVEKE